MHDHPDVRLVAITGEADELAAIRSALEDCRAYFERVEGHPASPEEASAILAELPPGVSAADKHVFAIRLADKIVGCVDLVRGYPDSRRAMLGLLLVGESWQGRGVGSAAYREVERIAAGWPECERVRIGVVRTNAGVLGFWRAMGFVETGEVRPYEYGSVRSEVIVLEKRVER